MPFFSALPKKKCAKNRVVNLIVLKLNENFSTAHGLIQRVASLVQAHASLAGKSFFPIYPTDWLFLCFSDDGSPVRIYHPYKQGWSNLTSYQLWRTLVPTLWYICHDVSFLSILLNITHCNLPISHLFGLCRSCRLAEWSALTKNIRAPLSSMRMNKKQEMRTFFPMDLLQGQAWKGWGGKVPVNVEALPSLPSHTIQPPPRWSFYSKENFAES